MTPAVSPARRARHRRRAAPRRRARDGHAQPAGRLRRRLRPHRSATFAELPQLDHDPVGRASVRERRRHQLARGSGAGGDDPRLRGPGERARMSSSDRATSPRCFPGDQEGRWDVTSEWSDEYLSTTYVDATIKLVAEHRPAIGRSTSARCRRGGTRLTAGPAASTPRPSRRWTRICAGSSRPCRTARRRSSLSPTMGTSTPADTGAGKTPSSRCEVSSEVAGVNLMAGEGSLEDVAPTIAVLAGVPVPGHSAGEASVLGDRDIDVPALASRRQSAARELRGARRSIRCSVPTPTMRLVPRVLDAHQARPRCRARRRG